MEVRARTDAAARLRSRDPALLSAEFRQRYFPSQHQRIRRFRAGHDPRHRPSRRQSGRTLGFANFYDRGLLSNPLFPPSGKVPFQPYNFAPRAGFAYSFGKTRPLVVRAGYGIFFVRIPQIYNSVMQTENGITDSQVFLNNTDYYDHQVFPSYPNPLVSCPLDRRERARCPPDSRRA